MVYGLVLATALSLQILPDRTGANMWLRMLVVRHLFIYVISYSILHLQSLCFVPTLCVWHLEHEAIQAMCSWVSSFFISIYASIIPYITYYMCVILKIEVGAVNLPHVMVIWIRPQIRANTRVFDFLLRHVYVFTSYNSIQFQFNWGNNSMKSLSRTKNSLRKCSLFQML